jgi:hypothetical protein
MLAPFIEKGTGIGDNSVSQNCLLFASIETEYSLTEAPSFAFVRKRVYVQLENVPDHDVLVTSNPVASYLYDKYRARQEITMMLTSVQCIRPERTSYLPIVERLRDNFRFNTNK